MKQTLLLGAADNVSGAVDVPLAMLLHQPLNLRSVVQTNCARSAKRINGDEARVALLLDVLLEVGGGIGVLEPT